MCCAPFTTTHALLLPNNIGRRTITIVGELERREERSDGTYVDYPGRRQKRDAPREEVRELDAERGCNRAALYTSKEPVRMHICGR